MPRSQALGFAIRSRRHVLPARPLVRTRTHSTTTSAPLRRCSAIPECSRSPFLIFTKPRPVRRHISSHTNYRPQAPFLDSHIYRDTSLPARIARFIRIRYLSTARKNNWKEQFKFQVRFQLYFWPMAGLMFMIWVGIVQIQTEHEYPTPREWSLWARWEGRSSKDLLERARQRGWFPDKGWANIGENLLTLVGRLEDPQGDGKGTKVQGEDGDGKILVDGVGRIGLDISAKSEQWRHGYWQALMGLARVAENLDGMCHRKGEKLTKTKFYKWENIPGPENPRPVPVAWDVDGAHLNVPIWNEVVAALEDPEVFYMRILTTKGFNNKQRLEAALACADWCDFKGLKETTANMYDWALDIAAGGLPEGSNNVVDIQTGVINSGKEALVSENLLKATTALGVWHAKKGEVKEALPIFLSVLRARKALPAAPAWLHEAAPSKRKMTKEERDARTDTSVMTGWFNGFIDFFRERDMVGSTDTGDEQPFHTLKEACEEVGIMTYIGEILFATSEQEKEKGLSWTRDSVEAAEAVLWFMDESGNETDSEGRQRCRECLETGLSNWKQMTKRMTNLAKKKQEEAEQSRGWLGLGLGQGSAIDKAIAEVKRWEDEDAQIELRRQRTASLVSPLVNRSAGTWSMNSPL